MPAAAQPLPAQPEQPRADAAPPQQQDDKQAALHAKYDAAFKATMDKPTDPAVLVRFAEVAVEFGDIEGAISALERLLLIDGDQPAVKLELGVLYYRIGSVEMARTYLEAARDSDSADNDIRQRAETFLKDGVKK
ncbi:MAG TPA: tetratricopeptide repeat protein [Reyranella sp.]|nr:tetratricopeptide repeat protein [Reyranella sp.]